MSKKVKDELLDHDYDGIREFDNDLPPWWVYLFYGCILFSIVYMVHYHILGTGPSQEQEYIAQMKEGEAIRKKAEAERGSVQLAFATDQTSLKAGAAVFSTNCAVCHGKLGEGLVGPNFTDNYWLHGNKVEDVVKVIAKGVPEKGMIPWEATLSQDQIVQVASYIHSLKGTNPPNQKEPQGELLQD